MLKGEKLTKVNDVVRLCRKLNVPLPNFKSSSWPLLKVEFESLRDIDVKGDFEFIDLPGIGETTIGDGDHFENLVRTVAKEANALVPIVSLKEISKDDWRQQLPHIIRTALGHAPEHVLCTHLDQAAKDRVEQQVASVAQVFWPKGENSVHRVLCCSSRLGMSARTLLHQSKQKKPDYKDFFVEGTPAYDCAEKILGVGNPEEKYNQIGLDVWNEAIRAQLKESRLESAATDLTTGIVMKTRVNALQLEGERLRILVNKGITEERRNLLDLSLSPEELEKALLAFRKTKSQLETLLKEWPEKDSRERTTLSEKLDKASELLMSRGNDIATEAIEKTFKEPHWQMRVEQMEDDLKFRRKTEVELFLRSIQREMESLIASVKREFVSFVRELATRARAERFDSLNSDIRQLVQHSMPADVLEQINNSLSSYGSDLESFILTGIRKKAVRAVVSKRHNPKTAYRAIENTIAKPFLRATSTEEGEDSQNSTEVASESSVTEEQDHTVEQLGFMLRAPVAVLATIPWLLGSAVWPFMAYSKNYVLNKKALTKELRQRAIIPYLEILRKDGRQTLDGVREQSSKIAVKAVREALEQEDLRYQQERRQKDAENPPPDVSAATSSIILLLNLLAAESGLRYLQDHLTRATS
ncbi:hypothetical protein BV22DRAFT_1041126 [Leucogyrophana mollusca]|uniref:Uncharacterized protein n=1 Tax=Leucogyrophana mollusca TaxID=85980 RepID=A0ACB8B090_9AGAM|nr:hypothetical protein BV22DRAFT_1041126 [Leucogyrophana mollusca]